MLKMKRIALFVCVLVLLLVSNTAEARRNRWNNGNNYNNYYSSSPGVQHTAYRPVLDATTNPSVDPASAVESADAESAVVEATGVESTPVKPATVDYSTRTAQGVANRMAASNYVGHFGGNPGYEGCGCGATPAAAYAICCYGNSGMATVDVGYARSANGMWYCCRRYR